MCLILCARKKIQEEPNYFNLQSLIQILCTFSDHSPFIGIFHRLCVANLSCRRLMLPRSMASCRMKMTHFGKIKTCFFQLSVTLFRLSVQHENLNHQQSQSVNIIPIFIALRPIQFNSIRIFVLNLL